MNNTPRSIIQDLKDNPERVIMVMHDSSNLSISIQVVDSDGNDYYKISRHNFNKMNNQEWIKKISDYNPALNINICKYVVNEK